EVLWAFERPIPDPEGLVTCCGVANRGVAVLNDTVFVTTIDAHLLALDIRTGRLRWITQVADYQVGYSITAAPIAIDGKVITGAAGGEMGIRGFVDAYDAETGNRVWRFDTVPAPGEPGSESWADEQWEIGGAATWMTGSYDPELDIVYWGTSHTVHEPDAPRSGYDKLYGSSMLALRGATGERVWHYQATPDDIHGFDAAQVPVLVDTELNGVQRKLLFNGNRNGFLYTLDRVTGELINATEFTRQTWAKSLDANGYPEINPDARPSRGGTLAWPNSVGGTNWWPPAYYRDAGYLCLPVVDGPSVYYSQDAEYAVGNPFVSVVGRQSFNEAAQRFIRCLNKSDGSLAWQKALTADGGRTQAITMSGLLATAGGLLFSADANDFIAVDADNGGELWRLNTGARVLAAPVTYQADGQQLVTVAAGKTLLTFGLPARP
ncbi:MAG: PQQ-binding-like beta-propeller repeat protein, partial [Gammaproteobacteria bacterium]|nr:PQQ-binding-like beta-propeller repeat protein [Gammaproteobacteria bacterium]